MRSLKASIIALGLTAGFASTASAQLSFDDASTNPFEWVSSYGGMSWNNAFVIDGAYYFGSAAAAGGFNTAMGSPRFVMGNGGGNALTISSASKFNLGGGKFAAAWKSGLTLNAAGYLNGVQTYNKSFNLDWDGAQFLALNMNGIDQVVFTSTGGTDAPGFAGRNSSFAMDDLDFSTSVSTIGEEQAAVAVVPEPMTMSLVGFGLLALGGVHARRRRASAAV